MGAERPEMLCVGGSWDGLRVHWQPRDGLCVLPPRPGIWPWLAEMAVDDIPMMACEYVPFCVGAGQVEYWVLRYRECSADEVMQRLVQSYHPAAAICVSDEVTGEAWEQAVEAMVQHMQGRS